MPWYIQSYIILFALLLLANIYHWIKGRGKLLIMIYELLSGLAVMALTAAYWMPAIMERLSAWSAIAFAAIIISDIVFSFRAGRADFGPEIAEGMSDKEFETAKTLSILFAAPGYICGALSSFELIRAAL